MTGQQPIQGAAQPARHVEGRVVRGTRARQIPVTGQWVVLHRVGPDHAGPIDSVRTAAGGRYAMAYRASGDTSAIYFASTSYDGVAYFTPPLRAVRASGDDTQIVVFDTTSGPVPLKIGGRHLVVGAARPDARRPIGEVYDLENDTTVTVVARDNASPLWTTRVPPGATSFQVNAGGTIAASAMTLSGTTVGLFAPVSPGIRQVAFTYDLPASAFPLSVPVERPTGILEVMVEDPSARVQGPHLREVAPVNAEGRIFRRFLAQDVGAEAVVRIDLPRAVGPGRERVYLGVGAIIVAAMLAALFVASRRSRRFPLPPTSPVAAELRESHVLAQRIAELDADFERIAALERDDGKRSSYEERRAELKRRLADALASERASG